MVIKMNKIIVKDVNKSIKGKKILNNINLELEGGLVHGFFGRNASGKTMLFRAIAGLITVDEGMIDVFGKRITDDNSFPDNMGIMIENIGLWKQLTGMETLRLIADIRNVIGTDEIRNALERVGLDPDDKRTYRKYSLGMKQRLAIAQAIMEKPDVILLDEPTNSLDEDGVALIRSLILEEKQRGALILLASHNKEDIGLLADRLFRIEMGVVFEQEWKNEE